MAGDGVRIDHLQIDIPGLTRDEADRLQKDIAMRIEHHLASDIPFREVRIMNIRVRLSDTTPKNQLAEMIAKQICKCMA